MENKLSFGLTLSLKEMAMRRVVVNLWKQPDVLCRFRDYNQFSLNVSGVESEMAYKINKLGCPEQLKREMLTIVTPIRLQIENWICFHLNSKCLADSRQQPFVHPFMEVLEKIWFTTAGTIDYGKTAEELINCKYSYAEQRYNLACWYCLDEYIPLFWEKLPEEMKRKFYNEDTIQICKPDLQFYWPYVLNGKLSKLDSITSKYYGHPTTFNQHAFEYTAKEGHKIAAKYFWEKLTSEEKDSCLTRIGLELLQMDSDSEIIVWKLSECLFQNRSDILYYLLTQMNREQQMKFFKRQPCIVLASLLHWPRQNLFLKTADHIWDFLSEMDISNLIKQMEILFAKSKYCFAKLFRDFFPHSPVNFRKMFVANECRRADFLERFFELEDSESVKIMFRNLSEADRMRLVSSEVFFNHLNSGNNMISQYDMLKLCLQEAALSKEDREAVKKAYVRTGRIYRYLPASGKEVYNRFFQLLDQVYGENKRSSEDENKAKKLCSDE